MSGTCSYGWVSEVVVVVYCMLRAVVMSPEGFGWQRWELHARVPAGYLWTFSCTYNVASLDLDKSSRKEHAFLTLWLESLLWKPFLLQN